MFAKEIARGLATTLHEMFAKPVTVQYPEEKARNGQFPSSSPFYYPLVALIGYE